MQRRAEVGGIHEVLIPGHRHRTVAGRRPESGSAGWRRIALSGLLAVAAGAGGCGNGSADAAHGPSSRIGTGTAIAGATMLGGLGETPGRFGYPRAIDSDPSGGSLWVIDKTARVQRIDPGTGKCLMWWRMPEFALGKPVGVCVAATGPGKDATLYIPDTHYSRILVVRPPPRPGDDPVEVRRFGSYGKEPGQFIYPTDVALTYGPGGLTPDRIYVSEYGGNDRVSVFDGEAKFLFSFGAFGSSTDPAQVEFNRPQSLAIAQGKAGQGAELLITDSRNHRIGRFTLEGKLLAWIGNADNPGSGLGQFNYPYGIVPLGDGTALVTEYGNNRVQRVELASGNGLQVWGRGGRGDGELATPWGIAVIGDRTFILDTGNNRIVSFPAPPPLRRS